MSASDWVARFASRVPPGPVLDLACGAGRHTRLFLDAGHPVVAVDRAMSLPAEPGLERLTADLEDGSPWPLGERTFAGVVVTNYLHRPLFPAILSALAPGGLLIYETFAVGNERFGRPRNPDFLLRAGELLEVVAGHCSPLRPLQAGLQVLAFEDLELEDRVIQRIAARR